jgi:hypothetical protein
MVSLSIFFSLIGIHTLFDLCKDLKSLYNSKIMIYIKETQSSILYIDLFLRLIRCCTFCSYDSLGYPEAIHEHAATWP